MKLWCQKDTGFPVPGLRFFPGFAHGFMDRTDMSAFTITTKPQTLIVERDGEPLPIDPSKPPYHVPTIADIHALPPNGFKVVSTFSGGGGSCTGYAMAGFNVVWASEFIAAAAATYRANHPHTILDTRDIRTIEPSEILSATGLGVGELDLFDSSPPCSSYSTAGKREKGWNKAKNYSGTQQRTDDLFPHAVRILKGLRPKAALFENVGGLVRGAAKGVFLQVLASLKAADYRVEARLIDASWCGVPQARQRLIFQCVRNDLNLSPAWPKPMPFRYTLADALRFATPSIEDAAWFEGYAIAPEWHKLKPGQQSEKYFQLVRTDPNKPCPTITATAGIPGAAGPTHFSEPRKFSIAECKAICSFPPDYHLSGTFAEQWERMGRSVPPLMMKRLAETVRDEVLRKIK